MIANYSTSWSLTDARGSREQGCLRVDSGLVGPTSSIISSAIPILLYLFLVIPDLDIVPVSEPFEELVHSALISDQILQCFGGEHICPHSIPINLCMLSGHLLFWVYLAIFAIISHFELKVNFLPLSLALRPTNSSNSVSMYIYTPLLTAFLYFQPSYGYRPSSSS